MKLFVWDFHGVLERNNEAAVFEITNRVLAENNVGVIMTKEQCHDFYGLKWFEYFQKLKPSLTINECQALQEQCFKFDIAHPEIIAKHIRRTPGARKVLKSIKKKHHQILISNTTPEAMTMFIKSIKVNKYFTDKNTFPVNSHRETHKTKKDVLLQYLTYCSVQYEEMVVIGDSPGDIELASLHPKSKSYLYTHPGKIHKDCLADYKINSLLEILREV